MPRGRIVELAGPPDSGKTTIGLLWIAAAQRQGCNAAFVDAECALSGDRAAACGVNREDLVVLSPSSGEQAAAMTESLLASFGVDLIVVDSAAALAPERERAAGDHSEDAHTDLLARRLRRLSMLASRSSACVLFLNQTRLDRNGQERSAGYRALGLHAAVRAFLSVERRTGDGQILKLSTRKNKVSAPFSEAWVELREGVSGGPRLLEARPAGPDRQWRAAAARRGG